MLRYSVCNITKRREYLQLLSRSVATCSSVFIRGLVQTLDELTNATEARLAARARVADATGLHGEAHTGGRCCALTSSVTRDARHTERMSERLQPKPETERMQVFQQLSSCECEAAVRLTKVAPVFESCTRAIGTQCSLNRPSFACCSAGSHSNQSPGSANTQRCANRASSSESSVATRTPLVVARSQPVSKSDLLQVTQGELGGYRVAVHLIFNLFGRRSSFECNAARVSQQELNRNCSQGNNNKTKPSLARCLARMPSRFCFCLSFHDATKRGAHSFC